jgi:hypothetical protein
LCLVGEHRRGHGALYDALNCGRVDIARLRRSVAGLVLPRVGDRIVVGVDVSPWLRAGAETSPARMFCHVAGRSRADKQMIPGWPYSVVAALETGRTSWTTILDAVRLGPGDDPTAVTATQLHEVIDRIITAGHWEPGDPPIVIVADAGYDIHRLTHLLVAEAGLPVELVGRIRSNRVLRLPAPPVTGPRGRGRPRKYAPDIALDKPETWPTPAHTTRTPSSRYGQITATSWDRASPRLARRGAWAGHPGLLPVLEGTLIRVHAHHLPAQPEHRHEHRPGEKPLRPMWLWVSTTNATAADIDRWWQAYRRRFDLEHTFRLFKQTLGWTRPRLRSPEAADRWTWLLIAAHTQLRLARPLAADLHRPWEKPVPPERLSPARVRRIFRHLRPHTALPARAPKNTRPGPGRPPGRRNHHPAPRHDVGKPAQPAPAPELTG